MYVDAQLLLSDAQSLSSTGAISTNVIDLGSVREIGAGEPMAVVVTVDTAADHTTGDEDYTFSVEIDSDPGFATANVVIARRVFESTPTAPAENSTLLVAGFQLVLPLPKLTIGEALRYLGLRYLLAGTTPTITCTAHLTTLANVPASASYPAGYTIS